jgi:hypothetical protein
LQNEPANADIHQMIFSPHEDERQEHAEQDDSSQETLHLGKNGKDEIGLQLRQEYFYDMSVGRFKLFYEPGPVKGYGSASPRQETGLVY